MDYRLYRAGKDEGVFPLEELHRRRMAGELDGSEYVWCEGMAGWELLDAVLRRERPVVAAAAATPPPLPPIKPAPSPHPIAAQQPVSKPRRLPAWVLAVIFGGVALFVAYGLFVGITVGRRMKTVVQTAVETVSSAGVSAMDAASRPAEWPTNSATIADLRARHLAFRLRQYVEAYEKRSEHSPEYDTDARGLIGNWIGSNYGGPVDTNLPPLRVLADRVASNPACNDPLAILVAGVNTDDRTHDFMTRMERAMSGFEHSRHLGYPKFYAVVMYIERAGGSHPERIAPLDAQALGYLHDTLTDGSLIPGDEQEMAEILLTGWAKNFFQRNDDAVIETARKAGKRSEWLTLVLEGSSDIDKAWRARGNGWANSVTEQGARDFAGDLMRARLALTQAWQLNTNYPLAADNMMNVALGAGSIGEMRLWFDRAIAAQLDDSEAWSRMRWGLRPRWYGSEESMLAFGITALNTRRYDTDVPRRFFDSVTDLESEEGLPDGGHIFGRDDVWPRMQELYEGYLAYTAKANEYSNGWHSTYAVVAYLAGKYDVAAQQLRAVNWNPVQENLSGWKCDVSLMPLEVAARTGPLGASVDQAETNREAGDFAAALKIYSQLAGDSRADDRTRAFIRDRIVTLGLEQKLAAGEWADFLPADSDMSGWCVQRGDCGRLPDGGLEVRPDDSGHMLYSRAQVGMNFEVRGQFEAVGGSAGPYQAGVMIGLPEPGEWTWDGFRILTEPNQGSWATFSTGWTQTRMRQAFTPGEMVDFDFRFQDGKVSATVGQTELFAQVTPQKNYYLLTNDFHVGLGAANYGHDGAIRYHSLRVRRLPGN